MNFILYAFLLFVVEIFVFYLSIGIDYYCKYKNKKLIKSKKIFITSKYGDKHYISKHSLNLQIFNYCYILLYLIIALVDTFIYGSIVFYYINIYSLALYGAVTFIFIIIISALSPVK